LPDQQRTTPKSGALRSIRGTSPDTSKKKGALSGRLFHNN
jgi:hypothetical protein